VFVCNKLSFNCKDCAFFFPLILKYIPTMIANMVTTTKIQMIAIAAGEIWFCDIEFELEELQVVTILLVHARAKYDFPVWRIPHVLSK